MHLRGFLNFGLRTIQMFRKTQMNQFHTLVNARLNTNEFLSRITPIITPAAGFKVKGHLRRRCKDCYFVRRNDRLYVICDKHPRHKQMQMVKDEKNTWVLTHATQGKIRPW